MTAFQEKMLIAAGIAALGVLWRAWRWWRRGEPFRDPWVGGDSSAEGAFGDDGGSSDGD